VPRIVRWFRLLAVVTVLSGLFAAIQPAAADSPAARSPRNASYTIAVDLDHEARTLRGSQQVEWTNIRRQPTSELRFHLYWNAWSNSHSSWMIEDRTRKRSGFSRNETKIEKEDWSWIEIDSIRLVSGESEFDLTGRMDFVAPDDGNPEDRTVLLVLLPQAVEPGETIRVQLEWRAKIPRNFARTGFRGDYYFFAQWFPKLGVYEDDGWNCHQFDASTEFYSDYGVYDVEMRVPESWVLGATGRAVGIRDNADGTVTHHYRQEDVHDFAWTVSPDFIVRTDRFEEAGLPPVDLRLLIQPEHLDQSAAHFRAAKAALKFYGIWYGPYPFGHATLVDPVYESGSSGMEYPTLFTCGTRLFNPSGNDRPESVTVHEMGHQFWYGIVGNNEFEHAWIDEGLNSFSTNRVLEREYGPRFYEQRYFEEFIPLRHGDLVLPRMQRRIDRYRRDGQRDAPLTPSFRYHVKSGGAVTYDKTSLWLMTLENYLGWETLQRILATFFERYRFSHPGPEDFLAIADEVSGRDLSWFFDQVLRDSVVFDYAVESADSVPLKPHGWIERGGRREYVEPPDDDDIVGERYRTEVVVRRLGAGRFPVDVLLVFEDRQEIREAWDGQAGWKRFVVERPAKLDYAVVDPDRVLMLDPDRVNNSRFREKPAALAAAKWSSKWMIWFQDMLTTFAFFL
jgi:hypothetical protein